MFKILFPPKLWLTMYSRKLKINFYLQALLPLYIFFLKAEVLTALSVHLPYTL